METTVGELIGMLEKFDKDEPIITTCRACRKGTNGERIKVEDRTNQMYGYRKKRRWGVVRNDR